MGDRMSALKQAFQVQLIVGACVNIYFDVHYILFIIHVSCLLSIFLILYI